MYAWISVLAWVSPLFLGLGLVALVAALKIPGHGLPETAAAVCLALFFLIQYLAGNAVGWALGLFLIGVALMAAEVFLLPGHGVLLALGALSALAGIFLALHPPPFTRTISDLGALGRTGLKLSMALSLALVGTLVLLRFLPKSVYFNRIALLNTAEGKAVDDADPALVGRTGRVTATLKPSGKAEFGGRILDVTAESEFLEAGRSVRVSAVQGGRILVRPA